MDLPLGSLPFFYKLHKAENIYSSVLFYFWMLTASVLQKSKILYPPQNPSACSVDISHSFILRFHIYALRECIISGFLKCISQLIPHGELEKQIISSNYHSPQVFFFSLSKAGIPPSLFSNQDISPVYSQNIFHTCFSSFNILSVPDNQQCVTELT